MVKTNELRIGNWVDYSDGNYYDGKRFKVSSISDRGVNEWRDMGASGCAEFEKLQPIPITEEILLKCGFVVIRGELCLDIKAKT